MAVMKLSTCARSRWEQGRGWRYFFATVILLAVSGCATAEMDEDAATPPDEWGGTDVPPTDVVEAGDAADRTDDLDTGPDAEVPREFEGDERGECSDRIDNDGDGGVDCGDPGCASSPDCMGGAGDAGADADRGADADAIVDADTGVDADAIADADRGADADAAVDADAGIDADATADPDRGADADAIADADHDAETGDTADAPPPAGSTCADAIDLTTSTSWSGTLGDYANNWTGGSGCTGLWGREIWFTVLVRAGQRLAVEETSATDVVLHRVPACGETRCTESTNEPERLSWHNDTGTDTVVLLVVEGAVSWTTGPVTLTVSLTTPPSGTVCNDPVDLTGLTAWTGSFADYLDLWDGDRLTCGFGTGAEVWFVITVQPGYRVVVSETSDTNVVLRRLTACGSTTCTWYSDTPETFQWHNDTGTPVTVLLNVERYDAGATGPLTLTISSTGLPPGSTCASAIDVTSLTAWTGSFSDYRNLWTGGAGCSAALGPEVWFRATVQPGHLFTLRETSTSQVAVQQVASCDTTRCTWSSGPSEFFSWYNDTGAAATVLLNVERLLSGATGPVEVRVTNGPPPQGYTCRDAIDLTTALAWSGTFGSYANRWTGGTGCHQVGGVEVWFTVTIPAGTALTFRETSATQTVIQRVESCDATSCLASSFIEEITVRNTGATPLRAIFAVEQRSGGDTAPLAVQATLTAF